MCLFNLASQLRIHLYLQWWPTWYCSDASCTEMQCHRLLRHSGAQNSSRWELHMQRSSVHLLCVSQKKHGGWNQKSQFCTQTKGQISTGLNVHGSGFLAQTSLLLLVSFSSRFFTAIQPWRFDSQSPLNSWCWDVCYLNSEAFIWAEMSEDGN
jgi:hypothetical protein